MTSIATSIPPTDEIEPQAHLSSPWEHDSTFSNCHECHSLFNHTNRRHHCRLCGKIFCHDCSRRRSLIPPSSIVLYPKGRGVTPPVSSISSKYYYHQNDGMEDGGVVNGGMEGYIPNNSDPERMVTYTSGTSPYRNSMGGADTLLYGRGLEERYKLAREPLRVCDPCFEELKPLQYELRASNSNAVRYNSIDPTDIKRLFNSPLAFTLGHEIRKAAYTLNNLLPLPKRTSNLFTPSKETYTVYHNPINNPINECANTCKTISPSLGDLDGVRIPARLLEQAKGVAVLTVVKGGFMVGGEYGSGLVVAKLEDDMEGDDSFHNSSKSFSKGEGNSIRWSAPSAIQAMGISWGALAGAQISDHVFLLMTDAAVELMMNDDGSIQLGADIGIAVGPLGRALEANVGATHTATAPIYTYSLSKGLYAGVSLDGKVIRTRHRMNEKFYGHQVHPAALLNGEVPSPPAAQPLYDALKRCHVYAMNNGNTKGGVAADIGEMCNPAAAKKRLSQIKSNTNDHGIYYRDDEGRYINYEDWSDNDVTMPPAEVDQHSFSFSDFSHSTSEASF